MLQVCQDLKDEADELRDFLETLESEDWDRPTLFMDWTPWDVIAHLHYFDGVSLDAASGEDVFEERRQRLFALRKENLSTRDLQRRELGHLDAETLLERWHATNHALADKLGACPPKARIPWFGPDMGVRMFTTARYMETWAHAQEIYDLKGKRRIHSDRIGNIVAIGVRTFGWTFVNRGREVPGPPPFVRLTAPSGALWEYNEQGDRERIEGSAVDFCMTVTQTRHVADTALKVTGPVATEWMSIAQCFAGAPSDPPPPGTRKSGPAR